MEIKEFQAKLSEALGLAVENGKKIHADTVEGIFAGNGLTEGQMQKVYEYLAIQGIQVDGRGPGSAAADGQTGKMCIRDRYVWLKTPGRLSSWEFFDELLRKANVVGTPGSGFGAHGEGYFRLSAFGTYENTVKAIERITKM